MNRRKHLIGQQWSRQFFADCLLEGGEIALVEQADIPLGQRHIHIRQEVVAFQWATGDHHFAIQAHLPRYKHCPGGRAVTAYAQGYAANRLSRAFQGRGQWLWAQRQAQAWVEPIDLNLMAASDVATL